MRCDWIAGILLVIIVLVRASTSQGTGSRNGNQCSHGDVRLVGGTNNREGRVQVCVNNTWGRVCSEGWDYSNSAVVCGQLGFLKTGTATTLGQVFGESSTSILLYDVNCSGNESSLLDCSHSRQDTYDCPYNEDVGIKCSEQSSCLDGDLYLFQESSFPYFDEQQNYVELTAGILEICHAGIFVPVCGKAIYDSKDVRVMCKHLLGYTDSIANIVPLSYELYSPGTDYIDSIHCHSDFLQSCSFDFRTDATCITDPAGGGIVCIGSKRVVDNGSDIENVDGSGSGSVCRHGDVRLVGGDSDHEGRVELCVANEWGTVCSDYWDDSDARVVCAQLGFSPTGAQALGYGYHGPGIGPIFLDFVTCSGFESTLLECRHAGIGNHKCSHYTDASVICQANNGSASVCKHGDVRLVGGASDHEGRVEVCVANEWWTVCDDFWDGFDASVVCSQLGFSPTGALALPNAYYGYGENLIILDDVSCTGFESTLLECDHSGIGIHDCSHSEDAGVSCQAVKEIGNDSVCEYGEVRLVGGEKYYEGRVEVCANNIWGTVCDDFWDSSDASVVCAQLGFSPTGAVSLGNSYHGLGTGPIVLDDVFCTGRENNLSQCRHLGIGKHNCIHREDASVLCKVIIYENYSGSGSGSGSVCNHGDVRLVGGASDHEGRVEVCLANKWGTVCDDAWDNNDASAVCAQLGFSPRDAWAVQQAQYGPGMGPIFLDDVSCTGFENTLLECHHPGIGIHNCGHNEDASVVCQALSGNYSACNYGDVRLVGGDGDHEGRVEVCVGNTWGTVCDNSWSGNEASVVCAQLGYSAIGAVPLGSAYYGYGEDPIVLDEVYCFGFESTLLECSHRGIGIHYCGHYQDAGVFCQVPSGNDSVCNHGDVRLSGGASDHDGRVEVCVDNIWGTVCDDSWDDNDASVVCAQLGFSPTGAVALREALYGYGEDPIVLDDVSCSGFESTLLECHHSGIGIHNCGHHEDASVFCRVISSVSSSGSASGSGSVCNHGDVRLVGGPNDQHKGRVEVCVDNEWGTICDDSWDDNDASVVCAQLGFSPTDAVAFGEAHYGFGVDPILLDDVSCSGYESSILDCSHPGIGIHDCVHMEDAAVACEVFISRSGSGSGSGSVCKYGEVRLVGGASDQEGRVEMCVDDEWGTICDDSWDDHDASVVCAQLGFSPTGAVALKGAPHGHGMGPIHLDDVSCARFESILLECRHPGIGVHDCGHREDASVMCQALSSNDSVCNHGDVRLVGGASDHEGRVEVCVSNTWGTVCDDSWNDIDAIVVCAQLGFSEGAVALGESYYGYGEDPIVLDEVSCSGFERTLLECDHDVLGIHDCGHSEDASVSCQGSGSGCSSGDVRLVGGASDQEGRVEVCASNRWGSVCAESWKKIDASVVCSQLGFPSTGAVALFDHGYGYGENLIILHDVSCSGFESTLLECHHSGIGMHSCVQSKQDAGVICRDLSCSIGDSNLLLQSTGLLPILNEYYHDISYGLLEVCHNGVFLPVCGQITSAPKFPELVCLSLGYTFAAHFDTAGEDSDNLAYGPGTNYVDSVKCGNSSLLSCTYEINTNAECVENPQLSSIYCSSIISSVSSSGSGSVCNHGDVRLVGGASNYEGRVEVCVDNEWGTVCDDSWDNNDASVVCAQLGFSTTGAVAIGESYMYYGFGMDPILLDNVSCSGYESILLDCSHPGIGMHDCLHAEDAAVACEALRVNESVCDDGDVRLVGGASNYDGRVEVCVDNVWGTVCDDSWDDSDASVVCAQLGFSPTDAVALFAASHGVGEGPIFLDEVSCSGSENALLECPHSGIGVHDCLYDEDASVICQSLSGNDSVCNHGDVRLVGGASEHEGRVEVCVANVWGTVCDDAWDSIDASVVCAQLGFSPAGAVALSSSFYGPGMGLIFLDNVFCSGRERTLLECQHGGIGNHNCAHVEDASVFCPVEEPCSDYGSLRLVNGETSNEGRVEVCVDTWGSVCNSAWDDRDAAVVCQQLGFSIHRASAVGNTVFGEGRGLIALHNVGCLGIENSLLSCSNGGLESNVCTHSNDTGVRCEDSFEMFLTGDSPVVLGDTVTFNLKVNKPVLELRCKISGTKYRDCSSGLIKFTGVSWRPNNNRYVFRADAVMGRGEEYILKRRFFPADDGRCTVHLINRGVLVIGKSVSVEFATTGPVSSLLCLLNERQIHNCTSPLHFPELEAGVYQLRVRPSGCSGAKSSFSLSETIHVFY